MATLLLVPLLLDPPGAKVEIERFFSAGELASLREQGRFTALLAGCWLLVEALLYVVLLAGGAATALARVAERGAVWLCRGRRRGQQVLATMLFSSGFVTSVFLCGLPLQLAAVLRAKRVGLYTAAWSWFARDTAIGLAVALVASALFFVGVSELRRRLGRRWWLVVAALAAPLVLGWGPVQHWLDQLSLRFRPLGDEQLRREIDRVAGLAGVRLHEVLVAETSRRGRGVGARVESGERLVLYDTLLERFDRRQVASVVAHELAHLRPQKQLWHALRTTLALSGLLWLMEAVLAAAARRRHGQGVGLVAALGILALVFLFLQPLSAALSRQGELAADREELRLTGDRDAFVRVRLALARINLADPDPPGWRRYLASHPPLAERLALALPRSAQRATHWLPRSPGLPPSGNPRRHSAP